MAKDYYGILGVSRDADDGEIKRAYRKLGARTAPRRQPGRRDARRSSRTSTRAYEVLTDPQKRRIVDLGGDPLETARGAAAVAAASPRPASAGSATSWTRSSAAAGATGGPRPAQPRPARRGRADPHRPDARGVRDAASPASSPSTPPCSARSCHGGGAEPGTHTETCDTCDGRGEIQNVQRSFLGQVVTARACPVCRGTGEVIPSPCHQCGGDGRVRSRRTVTVQVPAGVGDGMRIRMASQGEVGPGGGPAGDLYVEVSEERHDVLHPRRRRPALPRQPADDRGGAGHHAPAAHPRGRRGAARSSPARRRTRR